MKAFLGALAATLVLGGLFGVRGAQAQQPREYAVAGGYFYSQANGDERSPWGFTVSDNGGDLFWTQFRNYGGVGVLGYPISRRFLLDGFPTQAFQKGLLQWRGNEGRAVFVNVFDRLSAAGLDDWLSTVRRTPNRTIPEESPSATIGEITVARQKVLDDYPAIRRAYFAARDPVLQYGLPTSTVVDMGAAYVVRLQRAAIQQWKTDQPWAKAGEVTIANGGDIFKEAGLIPAAAQQPHAPPGNESAGPTPVVKIAEPQAAGTPGVVASVTPTPTPSPVPTPTATPIPPEGPIEIELKVEGKAISGQDLRISYRIWDRNGRGVGGALTTIIVRLPLNGERAYGTDPYFFSPSSNAGTGVVIAKLPPGMPPGTRIEIIASSQYPPWPAYHKLVITTE